MQPPRELDPLTGVLSRNTFIQEATVRLGEAAAGGMNECIWVVDLDGFFHLNRSHGQAAGDHLLIQVAQRLSQCTPEGSLVARLAGDRFAVLCKRVASAGDAAAGAHQLLARMLQPFELGWARVSVSSSIGMAMFPQQADTIDDLLIAAESMVREIKEKGGRDFGVYSSSVDRRLRIQRQLRQLLNTHSEGMSLALQPVVRAADGKIAYVEALLRMPVDVLEYMTTLEAIKAAEQDPTLALDLNDWVLANAAHFVSQLGARGIPPVSVNLSSHHLRSEPHLASLLALFKDNPQLATGLELEFMESSVSDTSAIYAEAVGKLRSLGVKVALDDFGVGYSSLSHLREMPVSRINLDRKFTLMSMRESRPWQVGSAMVSLARSLGITVMTKCIETKSHMDWMRHLGVDLLQGNLIAPPQSAFSFLRKWSWSHGGSPTTSRRRRGMALVQDSLWSR